MANFKRSETTARLVDYLKALTKGQHATFQELTKLVGEAMSINNAKLRSAARILLSEHAQVWVPYKPNDGKAVGLYRLNDQEIVRHHSNWYLGGAKRRLHRANETSGVVDLKQLSMAEQAQFSISCIQQELASQSLSKATRNRLEKVSMGNSNDMPSFNAVEWAISLMPKPKPMKLSK